MADNNYHWKFKNQNIFLQEKKKVLELDEIIF